MEHEEAQELIHPYVDGELDVSNARALEEHLASCEKCRAAELRIRTLREALRSDTPAYRAPARLRRNVRALVRREDRGTGQSFSWLMTCGAAAACALLLVAFGFFKISRASRDSVADQVIANHVRSLLATHLVDVASSDQHTVKPWFNGKVDFAPEVQDLAAEGFPLVGGRLDYLDGRTAVALVYRHSQHPINVLVASVPGRADVSLSTFTRRGYSLVHWTRREMDYWAVSDLNLPELRQLADLLRR